MEPVVVTCDGCGVRIRIARPRVALERRCPRCSTPLVAALAKTFEAGDRLDPPPPPVEPEPKRSRGLAHLALALAVVGSALAVGLQVSRGRGARPEAPAAPRAPALVAAQEPEPAVRPPDPAEDVEEPGPAEEVASASPEAVAEAKAEPAVPRPLPSVFEPSPFGPHADRGLSLPSAAGPREPAAPTSPGRAEAVPPPPEPEAGRLPASTVAGVDVGLKRIRSRTRTRGTMVSRPPPEAPEAPEGEPGRMRIRTRNGEAVVARVYGRSDGRTSVLMPDGQLGFTTGVAETDEPFVPATFDQIREDLTASGPFAKFQVRQSAHYLVLYQSTPTFAEASNKLLEDLYKNLSEAFRRRKIPIHDAEFPLVAIIFRTERDFRTHKKVDPDVQAYYEILSNRIYLYQKSERDQQSPEVAALRKPQTVAHEGTHQILQNIGIHPRLADWPLWLVEGLAEYCSPPTMTKRGAAWGGLGLVNPMHMATIHDLDDPASLHVEGATRQRLGRDPRKPLVEYLVTRTDLTPTDYALSWAVTHYLAMKRGTEFLAFLRTMSQIPPLQKRSAAEQLASFRAAFGPDLAKMDKTIAAYLSKLKYDPLPYYAVMFEQSIGRGRVRRATIVSQSPSMIRQWIEQVSEPTGGLPAWEIVPHPTKARALLTAEQWMGHH